MGKIKRGILGGFSGKVANVVGTSWKGIAVMKSLPLSVANPRTVSQVANRTRNSLVLAFGQELGLDNIRQMWNRWAVGMSGFNWFMSVNKDVFTSGGQFYPLRFLASIGSYLQPSSVGLVATADDSANTGHIDWSGIENYDSFSGNDVVKVVFIDALGNIQGGGYQTAMFSDDTIGILDMNVAAGQTLYAYMSVINESGTKICDSLRVAIVVAA